MTTAPKIGVAWLFETAATDPTATAIPALPIEGDPEFRLQKSLKHVYDEYRAYCLTSLFVKQSKPEIIAAIEVIPKEWSTWNSSLDSYYLPDIVKDLFDHYHRPGYVWDTPLYNKTLTPEDKIEIFRQLTQTTLRISAGKWIEAICKDLEGKPQLEVFLDGLATDPLYVNLPRSNWEQYYFTYSKNPATFEKLILSKTDVEDLPDSVYSSQYLTAKAIEYLYENDRKHKRRNKLASSPAVPEKLLYKWAGMRRGDLLAQIVKNPNASERVLLKVVKNPCCSWDTHIAICNSAKATSKILLPLLVHNGSIRDNAERAIQRIKEAKEAQCLKISNS